MRAICPSDHASILQLNHASESLLSPLDETGLLHLLGQASYQQVLILDGRVSAFLLALREGCGYASPNYRWFAGNFSRFLYIDRVVVAADARACGIGQALYRDLYRFARQTGVSTLTCEFDIDPPNLASQRFHAAFGFLEIGRQTLAHRCKSVSMQARAVACADCAGPTDCSCALAVSDKTT